MVGLALALFGLVVAFPDVWPLAVLVLPLAIGQVVLRPSQLPGYVSLVWVLLAVAMVQRPVDNRTLLFVIAVLVLGVFILWSGSRRAALGVAGTQSESMFLDLRERIQRQSGTVEVPSDWYADVAFRTAGNTPFAGDFLVSHRDIDRLHVVVVDVSGKGIEAGTRALHLTGAMSGLIGAVPPERLLVEANEYLVRQDWHEGFATAVHLCVELATGRAELRCAGHPPALVLSSGSGRWVGQADPGPALGLWSGAEFPSVSLEIKRGDAVLLYTDGMVEASDLELHQGIDRLAGLAERELRGGFDRGARRLLARQAHGGRDDDDRLLVLLHRR